MSAPHDFAVIGAGAGGLSVTAVAARLGLRVALIERDRMGGDCLNSGCVPSKSLLAAAHAARAARDAARFGVRADPVIDWSAVSAHVQASIAAIAPTDSAARYRGLGAEVIAGEARFIAPDTLAVGGQIIRARRIVIAAGSHAAIPPIPGLDGVPFLTNETIFGLPAPPDHLLILGGGPIGLELADAFAGLGVTVSVVEAGRVAGREDPELATLLRGALIRHGVHIHEGQAVAAVEPGPCLVLADGTRLGGSHLLVATGRRPDLAPLDLAAGGVRASAAGIATDHGLRSLTNRRVYAVGDIADPAGIGPRAFTHLAAHHAGIVIRRAVFHLPARLDLRAFPRVTYTSPELAQIGLTEAEARAAGHNPQILRWSLAENDRAIAEAAPEGLVKLVVSRGRLVGAGILAEGAGEMLGGLALAIGRRLPLSALAGMIVPYPTRAEAIARAAGTYYLDRLFAPRTRRLAGWLARLP